MPSTFTTSRGYTYAYTHTPSSILSSGKPTLLLVHGFPGSARDYAAQVAHFTSKGYPTITVDMLGYGGTSKPREVEAYAHSALAKDLVELLEEENVERVVAVGHDWGSATVSRLANFHADRFLGFVFLALAYFPPNPFNLEGAIEFMTKLTGSPTYGYWKFLARSDLEDVLKPEGRLESMGSAFFTKGRNAGGDIRNVGELDKWVEDGRRAEVLDSVGEEGLAKSVAEWKKGGVPVNYYKVQIEGVENERYAKIPESDKRILKPTLFVGAKRDIVCRADLGKATCERYIDADKLTYREVDAGHWLTLERPEETNEAIEGWLEGFVVGGAKARV